MNLRKRYYYVLLGAGLLSLTGQGDRQVDARLGFQHKRDNKGGTGSRMNSSNCT